MPVSAIESNSDLILRSRALSGALAPQSAASRRMAASPCVASILRDASLRDAPQNEVRMRSTIKHQRKKNGIASCPPAPRNDGLSLFRKPLDVIASEAKQSSTTHAAWLASSQELLEKTDLALGDTTLHVLQRRGADDDAIIAFGV